MRTARAFTMSLLGFGAIAGQAFSQTIGSQVRVDVTGPAARASNETTASSSEFNPNRIVAAWNDWRLSPSQASEVINCGGAISFDGGATWTDFLVRPPVANQSGVEGDPMTAYDDRTGTLWIGAISFAGNGGVYVARLDPASNTLSASKMARLSGSADKCWMAAGPRPALPNTTRAYITFNEGCIRSDDMGNTWTAPVALTSGIGFLPRVGPDGTLYVAYWDFNLGVRMRRSADGGVTFVDKLIATRLDTWGTQDGSRFPGVFRAPPMNYIAVDPNNGTLYCVYFDTTSISGGNRNVNIYFTKSTNKGDTWTAPKVINSDSATPQDQFFPWIEVDKNSRIHVMWYDGRHTVQNDVETDTNAFFDTYYSVSKDGGATWTEHRLTPVSWNAKNDGLVRSGSQFIGDYNAMAQAGNRVTPVYLDTHTGDPNIYANSIIFCPTDFNGDGFVNGDDFDDFVAAFLLGDLSADYNGDGFVNGDDFDDFNADFANGC